MDVTWITKQGSSCWCGCCWCCCWCCCFRCFYNCCRQYSGWVYTDIQLKPISISNYLDFVCFLVFRCAWRAFDVRFLPIYNKIVVDYCDLASELDLLNPNIFNHWQGHLEKECSAWNHWKDFLLLPIFCSHYLVPHSPPRWSCLPDTSATCHQDIGYHS